MDIHDLSNNLGYIENTGENKMDILMEFTECAEQVEPIHDTCLFESFEEDLSKCDNVSKQFEQKKHVIHKQEIINHTNEIMRSVLKQRYTDTNKCVKQMISAGKIHNTSNHRLNVLRNKNNITPMKKNNIKINQSPLLKDEFPTQIENIIQQDIVIQRDNMNTINVNTHNHQQYYQPEFGWYSAPLIPVTRQPNIESTKSKEVNLAEIITSVLQEVIVGKLLTIENVIGKLRVDFEESSMFTNKKKQNIILLNFEDDTMRPVLKIDEKYMNIISQWYDICDILFDIEETNVFIPEIITCQDVSGILFQDINYKFKDEYLNSYIPLAINNIISERTIKGLEKTYFKKSTGYIGEPKITHVPTNKIFANMGIILPENMVNQEYKKEKPEMKSIKDSGPIWQLNTAEIPEYSSLENNTGLLNIKNRSFDIRGDVIKNSSLKNNIESNIVSYNLDYNVLFPSFGSNCEVLHETVIDKPSDSKSCSSLFVLINDKSLQTITILNPDDDTIHIIKNYPEFGFIKLFDISTNTADIIHFIEREFNKALFNDVEEINKKLLVTSQYIDFSNKQNDTNHISTSEEQQVKKFLHSAYIIDDDINHKMKASVLYDLIIHSNVLKMEKDNEKIAGFRTRLSKYLKDIGLQKKRYNDGFYYYGIIKKPSNEFNFNGPKLDIMAEFKKRQDEYSQNIPCVPVTQMFEPI